MICPNALGRQELVKSSNGSRTRHVERLELKDIQWIVEELQHLPYESKLYADVPNDPLWVTSNFISMFNGEVLHGVVDRTSRSFLLFVTQRPWYADRLEIHEMILWVPERHRGGRIAYELVRAFAMEALEWHPHSVHAGHTLDITEKERTLRLYEKVGFSRHQGGVILRP